MRIFVAVVAASVMAISAGAVRAQDVESLARDLAAKPKPAEAPPACPKKLPDGTCPDTVDTRQMRIGGAASAPVATAATSMARAIRKDISMTFIKGSAELTASAKATLDRFAKALVSAGTYRPFTIEGHTDTTGPREVNAALSQSRADSVVRYLADKGVDKSRMTPKGYGSDRTLKGKSPEDPANRRVEVSAS